MTSNLMLLATGGYHAYVNHLVCTVSCVLYVCCSPTTCASLAGSLLISDHLLRSKDEQQRNTTVACTRKQNKEKSTGPAGKKMQSNYPNRPDKRRRMPL
ncbi:hypothetical protein K469DRAFT_253630 [Zopfia rhizophila CBS 207.26]|uniref:Uncharacterized protein n=1 Tax=Zopfia rhizophila CBS 207.26 TaxID=1314779 RepID=A0A6A6DSQ1_9PEZI|nr:hypothetical protein K469DRAFT_253630 [Zopfia rhizophila CBS 207.26]